MEQGTCRYYNGTHHNTHCRAGVCYRDVTTEPDRQLGVAFRIPCIKWDDKANKKYSPLSALQAEEYAKRGTCDRYEEPTPEDIAEHEARIEKALAKQMAVIPLITRIKKEHKGRNWSGVEDCPLCGTKLHLRHSGYNGHVWGRCETQNCLNWME